MVDLFEMCPVAHDTYRRGWRLTRGLGQITQSTNQHSKNSSQNVCGPTSRHSKDPSPLHPGPTCEDHVEVVLVALLLLQALHRDEQVQLQDGQPCTQQAQLGDDSNVAAKRHLPG